MKLERKFYERDTLTVARELLGKHLVHVMPEGITVGRIVETEAYIGPGDAAAHTYKGLRSSRTEVAYGPGGHAYVFVIYGMYHCFNIVTSTVEKPEMVLIRALEPVEGILLMKTRRGTEKERNLCSGPGKLCKAMGITRTDIGMDMCGDVLYLMEQPDIPGEEVEATPRINIDYAGEAIVYPWRFIIKGNPYVSKGLKSRKRK